jgi:hypothetical protein
MCWRRRRSNNNIINNHIEMIKNNDINDNENWCGCNNVWK